MSGVVFKLNAIALLVNSVVINEQLDVSIAQPEQLGVYLPPTEQVNISITQPEQLSVYLPTTEQLDVTI
jgi:hypothetical protein